jgi:AbrB family looped-hinge helix DNA binding protein
MPKVRLQDDGWLALPGGIRQKLGLTTGSQLEVELGKGSIVLRPAQQTEAAVAIRW